MGKAIRGALIAAAGWLVLLLLFLPLGVALHLIGFGGIWIEERASAAGPIWAEYTVRAFAVAVGGVAGLVTAWRLKPDWKRCFENIRYDWFAIIVQSFLLVAALVSIHKDLGKALWAFYIAVIAIPPLLAFGLFNRAELNDDAGD